MLLDSCYHFSRFPEANRSIQLFSACRHDSMHMRQALSLPEIFDLDPVRGPPTIEVVIMLSGPDPRSLPLWDFQM